MKPTLGVRLRSKIEGSLEFSSFYLGVVSRFNCIHSLLPPLIPVNKARVLPSTRLCCPRFVGSMTLSDSLLAACHFTVQAYRFAFYDPVVRGRVSLVPDTTFTACRSLYTGGFFRAACPDSTHVPWPSPLHTRLGILLSLKGFKLTMRQDSLHVAACNVASPFLAFHRASPLGSRHQVPASYVAVWSLPRPDSHRLVVPSFARRAVNYLSLTLTRIINWCRTPILMGT